VCRAGRPYRLLSGAFVEASAAFLTALRDGGAASLSEAGLSFDGDFTDTDLDTSWSSSPASSHDVRGVRRPPVSHALTARLAGPFFAVKENRRPGFRLQKGRFHVFDQLGVSSCFSPRWIRAPQRSTGVSPRLPATRAGHQAILDAIPVAGCGYASLVERATSARSTAEMAKLLGAFAAAESRSCDYVSRTSARARSGAQSR
jgi:hypothetical protein